VQGTGLHRLLEADQEVVTNAYPLDPGLASPK
jgi:hypothetical protein